MAEGTIEVRILDLPELKEKIKNMQSQLDLAVYHKDCYKQESEALRQQKDSAYKSLAAEREKNRLQQETIDSLGAVITKLKKDALNDMLFGKNRMLGESSTTQHFVHHDDGDFFIIRGHEKAFEAFKREVLAPYQQDIVKAKDAVQQLVGRLVKDGLSNV